jgi:protein ImuB
MARVVCVWLPTWPTDRLHRQPDPPPADRPLVAAWCLRYSPVAAPDPPDGIVIDVTGAAHLFGGEAALLDDVLVRLTNAGFAARAGGLPGSGVPAR